MTATRSIRCVSYPGNEMLPAGGDSANLALLQIGRTTVTPATGNSTWNFGETVRLADYTLPSTLPAGEPLRFFNLAWESLQATPNGFTVFVHVLDSSGNLVAQQDHEPQCRFARKYLDARYGVAGRIHNRVAAGPAAR